ncbi:pilin [Priestia filamentosa]|uniref:pilin n=1 Tax=Priestia filamentosa TaxID=1402861 RepID=UPI00397B72A1
MKTLKRVLTFSLLGLSVIIGISNSELRTYAANIPYQDGETGEQYGQTKKEAQSTIDKIAGANKDEMILDMGGVEKFQKKGNNVVQIIAGIIWGFSLISIVGAGFKMALSEGDTRRMREAKMQIIYSGIGIGVATFTFVIVELFKEVLG